MIYKKFCLAVVILVAMFSAQYASADDLAFTGSASFTGVTGIVKPVNDLQISGTTPTSTPIKLNVSNGTLSMSTTTGLTFTGPSTGSTLQFSGTLIDVNNALATLTYTRVGTGTDTLEASLVNPGEVFFSGTNHLYEYIPSLINWNDAKNAATLLTRHGATGYLATITSQDENDFVSARLGGAGWMGASDAAIECDWKWVTGPEVGTSFWSGNAGGSTVSGQYSNWNSSEPNNSGGNEDCGQFLSGGTGEWNDLDCTSTLAGYVAEFGASGNMPTVAAKSITLTTITGPLAPTAMVISNPTTTTLDLSWTSGGGSETDYIIEQSTGDCSGTFSQISSISTSSTTFTATGLSPEIRYCFRVKSTDGVINSSYATTTSDFTLPNNPLKPTIDTATETSLNVRIPSDGNPANTAEASMYSIEEATVGTFLQYPNGSLGASEGFTSSDAWNANTLNGLSPNTAYSFKTHISKRNSGFGYSAYSPISDIVYTHASVPTGLAGVTRSQTEISLSWTGNGTSYRVSNDTTGATTSVAGQTQLMAGLGCGRNYVFRVAALNGDGVVTDYSQGITVATNNCPQTSGGGPQFAWKLNANNEPVSIQTTNTPTSQENTLCAANQILTQNLRAPSRNGSYDKYTGGIVKEVKILQAHLNRLGFKSGPEDGIIGPISTGAIKRLQVFLKTTPDGYVGPITRSLLNSSCK